MTAKIRLFQTAFPVAVLALAALAPAPARADFFDDARRTFTTDIPHFFQDDIPCAFGGKPTSGAKSSCNSSAKPATQKTPGNSDKVEPAPPPPPPAPPPPSTSE